MFVTINRTVRAWLLGALGVLAVLAVARLSLGISGWRAAWPAGSSDLVIQRGPSDRRTVALTFDVVEGDTVPVQVLDVLRWRQVRATFFVTGHWARGHRELLRRMVDEGHQVESRGDGEAPLTGRPVEALQSDLQRGVEAVARITGRPVRFLRPPALAYDDRVLAAAGRLGLRVVLWSLDAHDWMSPGVDYLVDRVARETRPGSIVLLHASDFAPQTPQALAGMLDALGRAGLRPVTLGELLEGAGDHPTGFQAHRGQG